MHHAAMSGPRISGPDLRTNVDGGGYSSVVLLQHVLGSEFGFSNAGLGPGSDLRSQNNGPGTTGGSSTSPFRQALIVSFSHLNFRAVMTSLLTKFMIVDKKFW